MRHGEVHNPDKILYGRLPDYHLSDKGRAQAQPVADWLADRDIVYVVASPLERAQETATPIAERRGLPIDTDDDLIESMNIFQGQRVSPGDGALRDPAQLVASAQSAHAVVGRAVRRDRGADDGCAAPRPGQGGGPRGGVRQPSATGGDTAPGDDGKAAAPLSRLGGCATSPRSRRSTSTGTRFVGWGYSELAGQ